MARVSSPFLGDCERSALQVKLVSFTASKTSFKQQNLSHKLICHDIEQKSHAIAKQVERDETYIGGKPCLFSSQQPGLRSS